MADINGYLQIISQSSGGEEVRDAIVNAMNEINQDSAFKVTNKTITSRISELNKTYSARSGEVWKQVTINVTDDSDNPISTGNMQEYDLEVNNNTANRTYNAKQEHGENAIWGNVIVNVDHSGEWDDIEDNVKITMSDLDNSGTFSASKISKTAMKSITFTDIDPVKEKGGTVGPGGQVTYPITFDAKDGAWEDGRKTKTINITEGNLIDINPKPKKTGQMCIGWDGDSTASRKTTVFAKYDSPQVLVGEISDSWDVILANGGAEYPIGSYKTLIVGDLDGDGEGGNTIQIPYEADLRQFPDIGQLPSGTYPYYAEFCMVKVAEGEGGTTSSWLSMMPKLLYNAPVPSHIFDYDDRSGTLWLYDKSKQMEWLNSVFINWCLPSEFKAHIKPVVKHFRWTTQAGTNINKPISQRIWLPSVKELWISGFDDEAPWGGDLEEEIELDTKELFTNAIGEEYFNSWLALQDGNARMELLDLIGGTWPDINGFGGTRDLGRGSNQSDFVLAPVKHTFTIEEQQVETSIFTGKVVSRLRAVSPIMIGFCISA